MTWIEPKTNWTPDDPITENDLNRMEGNTKSLKNGVDEAVNKASAASDNVSDLLQDLESHYNDYTNPHNVDKTQIGLSNVTNDKQMPMAGGQFTGIVKAHPNTSYTTAQIRNIILSPNDADVNAMGNGDIWIKYRE